jgi:hypothetical protein
MSVWSRCLYDHNVSMITMSVWFKCLYDHDVCTIPMSVWSQCLFDHNVSMITMYNPNVSMITMSVWSRCLYDHNVSMIAMSVWSQCLYYHNVCMITMSVWFQCLNDHTVSTIAVDPHTLTPQTPQHFLSQSPLYHKFTQNCSSRPRNISHLPIPPNCSCHMQRTSTLHSSMHDCLQFQPYVPWPTQSDVSDTREFFPSSANYTQSSAY